MDQHPIPQDVTGFQFKLIGAMTVKQFGYVASGVIMAVVLYYLPLNTPFSLLIKLFLIPLLGAGGVVIAFVPIDGRPIDIMTSNFVKALFSPNQYIYQRQGRKLSFTQIADAKVAPAAQKTPNQNMQAVQKPLTPAQPTNKEEQLRVLLMNSRSQVKNDLDKKEAAFLNTLAIPVAKPNITPIGSSPATTTTPVSVPATPVMKAASLPTPAPLTPQPQGNNAPQVAPKNTQAPDTKESLDLKESQLEQQLEAAKKEETQNTIPTAQNSAHQKVTVLQQQIDEIHQQKQQLEDELAKLQSQLTQQKAPDGATVPTTVQTVQPAPAQDPLHVRTIPQEITKKAGLPHVSDTPNVIVGIVKDPRGNVLSNILVEVKDKNGNPVRAFKTSALGQFASATPLSVGTYTMELEDPKKLHRFDVIQITANNQIMLPIEVISHDAREELRQQLFAS